MLALKHIHLTAFSYEARETWLIFNNSAAKQRGYNELAKLDNETNTIS